MKEPTEKSIKKIENYVSKYREKTNTYAHPDPSIPETVIKGLAANLDEVGRPLCPCNFYKNKKEEVKDTDWLCACEEMKKYKFCHCLLFVNKDGQPITEHLPDDHYAKETYGIHKE
jgi:ferredoxin-thioredoxin reductase catalytic chain